MLSRERIEELRDWAQWDFYASGQCPGEFPGSQDEFMELCDLALRATDLGEKYEELIMAVANKHPGETRHETALRYIQQAEEPSDEAECAQEDQP